MQFIFLMYISICKNFARQLSDLIIKYYTLILFLNIIIKYTDLHSINMIKMKLLIHNQLLIIIINNNVY